MPLRPTFELAVCTPCAFTLFILSRARVHSMCIHALHSLPCAPHVRSRSPLILSAVPVCTNNPHARQLLCPCVLFTVSQQSTAGHLACLSSPCLAIMRVSAVHAWP